jgi:hypothetical protein
VPNETRSEEKRFQLGLSRPLSSEKVSFDQKKSRPKQIKLFLGKKNFVRQKQNIFSEKKILSGQDKTFSGQKRFCSAQTKFFPRKTMLFCSERSVFSGGVILSAQNKTFFGQKKFCPSQTKYFLPGRDFSTPTRKEVSMAVAPKRVLVPLPHNTQPSRRVP